MAVPARRRSARWPAVAVAVVIALAGAGLGWLWAEVAPRLQVIKAEGGAFLYAESEPEQPIAGDGWFAIIGAVTGIVFALLVWFLLRRYRGVPMLVALVVGSLAAAVLASWVGYHLGDAQFVRADQAAAVGDTLSGPLRLAMTDFDPKAAWKLVPTGVLAVQALLAAFTYTFLAGFSPYPDLRGEPAEDQFGPGFAGSSDSATGTART